MKKTVISLLLFVFCLSGLNAQSYDNYRSTLRDATVKISDTNLPIIFIEVEGQMILKDQYILGHMKVIDNGQGQYNYGDTIAHPGQHIDYEGPIAIKYRGNTSFSNSDKKPLQIRTLKTDLLPDDGGEKQKVSILGMGKDNKWMFIAPWADKVMFRDILSFELARPWMDYVPTVKLCEVFLDGTYYGVYGFGERVSKGKSRLDLHDPGADEGDLSGDYHVEIDRSDDPYYPSKHRPWSNLNGDEAWGKTIKYQYKDPENEDWATFPGAKEALHAEIDAMEDAFLTDHWQDPETGYQSKIDMTSFIDYMLSNEVANNIDGYRLSTNLYKHSDARARNEGIDPRWKMSLWDFNIAWGNANYYKGQRTDSWHYTFNQRETGDGEQIPFYWYRMLNDGNYIKALKDRWKAYREANYSDTRIMQTVDSLALMLRIRGAVDRNQRAWQIIGRSVWPNPYNGKTFDEELSYLKQWIRNRLAFMDQAIEAMEIPDEPKPVVPKNTEPVAVASGWNADVVVEELPAASHATHGIDGGNRAFYSATLKAEGGLPADRTVTSTGEGVTYNLSDYADNNILALRQQGQSATVTFQPFNTSDLYILATSGNGVSDITAVINYADGTTANAQLVTIADWSLRNPTGAEAMAGIGNINITNDTFNGDQCHDALYDIHLTADEQRQIASVTFTLNNSALASIFAFARQIPQQNDYEPVGIKEGFNIDVIAETTSISNSISGTLDGSYAFYAQQAHQEGGLPAERTFTAEGSGVTYTFSPYQADNALNLANSGAKGELIPEELFNTPELRLLATSALGTSVVIVTINYEDGTSQQSDPVYFNDWYVESPSGTEALSGLGRIDTRRSNFNRALDSRMAFTLYDAPIPADEHKNIRSVTIESAAESIPTIFALSKKKTDVEPSPVDGIGRPVAAEATTPAVYSPEGIRRQQLQPGLNIIRQADGTTMKVWEKGR